MASVPQALAKRKIVPACRNQWGATTELLRQSLPNHPEQNHTSIMKQSILTSAALAAVAACAEHALAGNVALGKPVVAGSYYAGYVPESVVDGNLNTYWNGGT